MNSLIQPIFNEKPWGSEITWSITDHYMTKTIDIDPFKTNDLIVFERKEKSIIVIQNTLVLAEGSCCDEEELEYFELPVGYSHYISPGRIHRYGATDEPVTIIEVSSPELDEGIVISYEHIT